jgi:hypothetical protein
VSKFYRKTLDIFYLMEKMKKYQSKSCRHPAVNLTEYRTTCISVCPHICIRIDWFYEKQSFTIADTYMYTTKAVQMYCSAGTKVRQSLKEKFFWKQFDMIRTFTTSMQSRSVNAVIGTRHVHGLPKIAYFHAEHNLMNQYILNENFWRSFRLYLGTYLA